MRRAVVICGGMMANEHSEELGPNRLPTRESLEDSDPIGGIGTPPVADEEESPAEEPFHGPGSPASSPGSPLLEMSGGRSSFAEPAVEVERRYSRASPYNLR
jgi:hypothetical protein